MQDASWLGAGIALVSMLLGCREPASGDDLIVVTDRGPVRGIEDEGMRVFLGIPYAAPPVGARRFRPPDLPAPWHEPLVADAFGPGCPQEPGGLSQVSETDEDCLSLNVWAHADGAVRPVMIFIHGGGHVGGSSGEVMVGMDTPLYGGASFASKGDVVLVTVNYRLGALGFYATEAMAAEGPAGNQGIRDVIAALEWVQRNIARFGGDPENVSVFGESAGAGNTCALLASPRADGLYHRAIIQSGRCVQMPGMNEGSLGRAALIERGDAITEAAGCRGAADELACMRALSADAIVEATAAGGGSLLGLPVADVSPGIDGDLIEEQVIDRLERGEHDVPIVVGSNADELDLAANLLVTTAESYPALVREMLGDDVADEVLEMYPAADLDSAQDAFGTLASDVAFICPALAVAAAAGGGAHPVYAYHFTHQPGGLFTPFGAFHGLELTYLFGHLHPWTDPTADDEAVAATMQRAWGGFARDGVPEGDPAWPPHGASGGPIWQIASAPSVTSEIRQGRCAELEALGLVR